MDLKEFYGMPVIRDGDNVFIINNMPDLLSRQSMFDQCEFLSLRFDEYACPFDFATEFDKWIKWKIREHGNHEHTGQIITSMIADVERIKRHKKEKPFAFKVLTDYGATM